MIKRHISLAIIIVSISLTSLSAQKASSYTKEQNLSFYCDIMANAYEDQSRSRARDKFNILFVEALEEHGSFDNDFADLKWVSIKKSEDESLRMITWQLKENDEKFVYYGYIQTSDGKLVELIDHSSEMDRVTNVTLDPDDWYGALYYNMIESGKGKDKYYLLFGYNGYSSEEHVKVVDVLHFEGKRPVFGKAVFNNKGEMSKRIYLRYYAESNVNCNFDNELNMIIHDFIVARVTTPKGNRVASIPDGTYVAYEATKNEWSIIEQMKTVEPQNVNSPSSGSRNRNPLGINKKRK